MSRAPDTVIYGCMRIAGQTDDQARDKTAEEASAFAAIEAALDAGITHFDHADIYGRGACEEVFGRYLAANAGLRDRIFITNKCGIRRRGEPQADAPGRYDFSAEWIEQSCEASLQRLGIDTIDWYLLHRPDVLMEPDVVATAFDRLRQAGKVREFGVSNFTPSQISLLQSSLDRPLVCNQIEIHPLRRSPFENGTLDYLYQHSIVPTSWSPVAGGRLFGEAADDEAARTMAALDVEAESLGVSRFVVLLAWLRRHPSGIVPIIGTLKPDRIREAATAANVQLSREAWYRIYVAARGERMP